MPSRFSHTLILLIATAILAAGRAAAQSAAETTQPPELSTDRPDQSEAPRLVPSGYLQAEAGAMTTHFREDDPAVGPRTTHTGMLFLRYGLARRIELRAVLEEGPGRDRFIQETTQGLYPLALGTKVSIVEEQRGLLPEASLVAYVNLPFLARADSQRGQYNPAFIAAFENKFLERWEIEYNVGWKMDAFDKGYEWMASASLHRELSKKLKLFAEYFAHYAPADAPLHNWDGGAMYLLADNIQVDAAVGSSIRAQPANRNFFGAVGLSARMPR